MPGPKIAYQHFCPAARALEVVGEKWSLLIVRDLLAGPRRFSDLRRSLASITAKWLSLRLQELEETGIVEREAAGPREVWYRLTPKGQALAPVVEELLVWGIDYALRPPLPGEVMNAGRTTATFVMYLNRRHIRPDGPRTWLVRLTDGRGYTIRFDGERWSQQRGEAPAEVVVEASPEDWLTFLSAVPDERRGLLTRMHVEGPPERVDEFVRLLGRQEAPVSAA